TAYRHFTLGYSQRSWAQVEELLRLAQITMVIDARREISSPFKPEFAEAALSQAVEAAGSGWLALAGLGVRLEDRRGIGDPNDIETVLDEYRKRLTQVSLRNALGDRLEKERIAFLTQELNPRTSHRQFIALQLEAMGYKTLDL